jgi:hypothetical protein
MVESNEVRALYVVSGSNMLLYNKYFALTGDEYVPVVLSVVLYRDQYVLNNSYYKRSIENCIICVAFYESKTYFWKASLTMDPKTTSKRQISKTVPARNGEPSASGRYADHRQTMNSVVVEERKRVNKNNAIDVNIRERDLLHRNLDRTKEKERRQTYGMDSKQTDQTAEFAIDVHATKRSSSNKMESVRVDQLHNHSSKEHRLRPEVASVDSRAGKAAALRKSNSDRALVTPTGTQKPPLKPRRPRRCKSVTSSTKSTSSATYVSSDSSEGEKDDDDDSIETPDLRIRVFDVQSNSPNNSSSWSTASSLAPYESADDNGRFAMVPYQDSKKKKKSRSRQQYKKASIAASNSDDDDVDPFFNLGDDDFANVYNLSSSDTDTSEVDLDEMIAESSARWKTTVNAIVTKTVTATQGSLIVPSAAVAASSLASSIVTTSRKDCTVLRDPLVLRHVDDSGVIEKQQAEIESLRAALNAQRQHSSQGNYHKFSTEMLVLPEAAEFEAPSANYNFRNFSSPSTEDITIDCVPLEHIEVNHDASDPNSSNYWQDDLTVWSGFNTVTGGMDGFSTSNNEAGEKGGAAKPPLTKRPDAASNSGASALNGVPVRVVQDMKVDLSSEMTGIIRKAVYSGTINAHTRLPEGQGTFRFTETGDTYQGEVLAGQMHGAGTYTFGRSSRKTSNKSKRPKELKGTFEFNVFIG